MADIEFYQEDLEDGQDDMGDGDLAVDEYGETYNPDERLSPIQKLEKYMDSENIYSRQMVARNLLETIRIVGNNEEDANTVLKAMVKLSEDQEPTVRTELMDQVPNIAVHCHEYHSLFQNPISTYILPVITRYLMDPNNMVRKTTQAALLVLLDQELIDKGDIEREICPVLMELSSSDSLDDFRTEAVALMSKMAPMVGQDLTVKLFLPRFAQMCTDPLFHVRKVCAANFGEMCHVVGQNNAEEVLLDKFFYLCEDGVWGVRKACAECFMSVSLSCSPEVRHSQLAQLFINLICDQSRWVRIEAFQQLGCFIYTFADPSLTGLYVREDGSLEIIKTESIQDRTSSIITTDSEESSKSSQESEETGKNCTEPMDIDTSEETSESVSEKDVSVEEVRAKCYSDISNNKGDTDSDDKSRLLEDDKSKASEKCLGSNNNNVSSDDTSPAGQESVFPSTSDKDRTTLHIHIDNNLEYNSFNYWRDPLPAIDIDVDIVDKKPHHIHVKTTVADEHSKDRAEKQASNIVDAITKAIVSLDTSESSGATGTSDEVLFHTASVSEVPEEAEEVANIGSMHVLGQHVDQRTMTIVNGVVQDISNTSLGFCPLEESPALSADTSHDESSCWGDAFDQQDVVPQALLEHYLSMTDPSRAQTVDSEIAKHCAHSLPAVACTLGRKNWPCLKDLYETLASDMQWKVRRTLAFSIHELARILGEEITCRDLVPVFNGFFKDLDEVRVGILKHLADFLRMLRPDIRQDYLEKLPDFLKMDNHRNWRFREELSIQLIELIELYSPEEVNNHIVPIAFTLSDDRVAEIRILAFRVLSAILKKLSQSGDRQLPLAFINDVIDKFADCNKWLKRQMYAVICQHILEESCITPERFAKDMMPSLLALACDNIPNVRIAVAKVVAANVITSDYFTGAHNPHHEDLLKTIQEMKKDKDRDVRFFISEPAPETQLGDNNTIPV